MADDAQPEVKTRAKRAARVPGDTGADDAQPEVGAAVEAEERPVAHQRHSLPDFRHKSAEFARKWFKDNPGVAKRGVLTSEGWYVHPDSFKEARKAEV